MAPSRRRYDVNPESAKLQSSIFRGVSLHKGTQKYRANIKIKGKKIALGAYDNELDAAKAFDRAAIRYRGGRALVNFPTRTKGVQAPVQDVERASSESSSVVLPDTKADSEMSDPLLALPEEDSEKNTCTSYEAESAAEDLLLHAVSCIGDLDDIDLTDVLECEAGHHAVLSPFHQADALASDSSSNDGSHRHCDARGSVQQSEADSACRVLPQPTVASVPAPANGRGCVAPARPQRSGLSMADYRRLFIERAHSDCDSSDTDMDVHADWAPTHPAAYADSPACSRKMAWWRRQLTTHAEVALAEPLHVGPAAYHRYDQPLCFGPTSTYPAAYGARRPGLVPY